MTFEEYYRIGKEVISRDDTLYVSIDVEGDGPAGYGSLASVGAVAMTGDEFYVEIAPQYETYFPECRSFLEGLGMTRSRLEVNGVPLVEAGVSMRRWADELRERYTRPLVAVMFNAGYDWAHIDLMFAKAADAYPDAFPKKGEYMQPVCNPFGIAPLDSKSLAMCLDMSRWSWRATERCNLPRQIVPDAPVTHHALEDARRQLQQLCAMVGYIHSRSDK